ncbi:MAG: 3-phosphoshikimate 1-carboxyvinyltransferase [Candidatus Wallbacteria bacterium]|nr:3-phosphoshikimate 1-carboxyvinyltransferase [Candidatus Wallbacteria bacterium]
MKVRIKGINSASGKIMLPGDKSISHRAAIIGTIANGVTEISNFASSADCASTLKCLKALGVNFERTDNFVRIKGVGLHGLKEPTAVLDCGNSGTTTRLLTGLLAAQPFLSVLSGDESLNSRPMARAIEPLRKMGANISAREGGKYAPIVVQGSTALTAGNFVMPVPSAQVKSALILAGLYAEGSQKISEPSLSRDHTERMLQYFGVDIQTEGLLVALGKHRQPTGRKMSVPGDISAAAFFLVLGAFRGDGIILSDVGVNPTRTGILEYFQSAGASFNLAGQRDTCNEPVADIEISRSRLSGSKISGPLIPLLIDELPVLAVAATQALGLTEVRDAAELRIKESDRIKAIVSQLQKFGADISECQDGFTVNGPVQLKGAECEGFDDHRIVMALTIAGLLASGETVVNGCECVNISFPEFFDRIREICGHECISFE